MEPLFVNQYTRDEAITKEIYRFYYLTPLTITLYIAAGISFVVNLVLMSLDHAAYNSQTLLATAILLLSPLLYRHHLSIAIKQDREWFGQPPSIVCEVSETSIRIGTNGHFSQEVPLSQIHHAKETKHLILLSSHARLLYILRKDSFTKGSFPEFNRFLYEKKVRFK